MGVTLIGASRGAVDCHFVQVRPFAENITKCISFPFSLSVELSISCFGANAKNPRPVHGFAGVLRYFEKCSFSQDAFVPIPGSNCSDMVERFKLRIGIAPLLDHFGLAHV